MGINEDILEYAGRGLYEDDPMFSRLSSGEVPRPVEDFYKSFDSFDEDRPEKHPPVELDPLKLLNVGPWTQEQYGRLGEKLKAGTQEVGQTSAIAALSTSEWLNRMKKKYVPYYEESTAVKALADTISNFGPGIMAMDENQELALSMLAESEFLKADPRGLENHNWFEGVVSVGPQIGSMILASVAGGPWAGFGMMGMQILGGTYDNLIQEGTPPDEAYYWSLGNAIIQGALEMAPFHLAMKMFKPRMPLLQKMKALGGIVSTEFFTEWAQAYPDSFINIFATNPDKELFQRAELFWDEIGETTKQGMYEGTLTAPWALLFAPFGAVASRKKRKEDENYHQLRMEEERRGKGPAVDAADEGDFVPYSDEDIISRRAPNRKASSVTQAHLDMMTPEQQQAFRNFSFHQRFVELAENIPGNPVEIENRKERALEAADEFARTLRIVGDDVFTRQPNLDNIQKERILQDLGLVQTQDQNEGAMEQIGIIRGNGIPDRPAFGGPEPIGLTQEEYNRRVNLLGTLSDSYFVDRSQIPPDLRAAYDMMVEQVGVSEPKGVTFIDEAGNPNLAEGMAHGYGSSYPGWFKEPFTIRYRDSRIKKDKAGKTVMESDKKVPVREIQEKKEEFKYGLNRKDFFDLIEKLDTGKLLTARQSAISDHIMGIAQAMKASDPELFLGGEIAQLESDGYEIIGTSINVDSLELGDQAVIEGDGYSWDQYTVVSEDDGAGNMVLDSLTDRIQIPPSDEIDVIGVKRNDYWKTMYDIGGAQGISDAPRTLPGIEDIEPLHQLTNVYSIAQMEEDFAQNLPDLAEFFENPEGIREPDVGDRRQTETPVEDDKRSGIERRENWQMTSDIDKMTPAERTEALEFTRKFAVEDVLTGLLNRNALELHKEEFGADVPFVSIDVDGLKYYNDMTKEGTLPTGERVIGGHAMGDQALALMGQAMTEAAETTGIINRIKLYRMGGDEYGVSGIDRDSVSRDELETLRLAIKDSASQIVLDFLGKDDNIHYQLNGLAFTSATGGTISNAISAAEKIKDGLPAEYATITEEGKEKPTRARIPGTRVEVNYLPVGWSQKSEGLLASQTRANEKVGRDLGQGKLIDEQIVGVEFTGHNAQWTPEDTVEDAIAWTTGHVSRLAKSPALPEANAWNFILEELAYEAEDIGMPPSTLAFAVSSGALQQAQEYLTNEQLGVVQMAEAGAAPVPAIATPMVAIPATIEVAPEEVTEMIDDLELVDGNLKDKAKNKLSQIYSQLGNFGKKPSGPPWARNLKSLGAQITGSMTRLNNLTKRLTWKGRASTPEQVAVQKKRVDGLLSTDISTPEYTTLTDRQADAQAKIWIRDSVDKIKKSTVIEMPLMQPQLPAPPPKLVAPEVVLAETLPSPEEAPTVKSRKAKFIRENMDFMPMSETATVRYIDPETGELTETEEPAREAFSDMEENVNEFYQLMECLKT